LDTYVREALDIVRDLDWSTREGPTCPVGEFLGILVIVSTRAVGEIEAIGIAPSLPRVLSDPVGTCGELLWRNEWHVHVLRERIPAIRETSGSS
jgi:hypothetical protein